MKKKLIISALVATLLMITGCGENSDSDNGGSGSSGGSGSEVVLEGTWADDEGTLTFSGDKMAWAISSEGNTTKVEFNTNFTVKTRGTKVIQPNNKTVTKLEMTNVNACTYKLAILTQELVDYNNGRQLCGITWRVNVLEDITTCVFPGDTESVCDEYRSDIVNNENKTKDIAYIDGNKLYFGDDEQGVDSDGYADALDTDYSTRQ